MKDFVVFKNVTKHYHAGSHTIAASENISFSINKGEFCVIIGPSGAGKTTLLNMLGGMDSCDSGIILLDGKEISGLNESQLTSYRRYDVGFVFQFYNLIENLTALENVQLASEICPNHSSPVKVLEEVGLSSRMGNYPSQLSGGEQQRVSIARALAKNPKILLCDEPTGALDYSTGKNILKLLQESSRKNKQTVILITHNQAIAPMADKVIYLKNGKVQKIVSNPSPVPAERIEW